MLHAILWKPSENGISIINIFVKVTYLLLVTVLFPVMTLTSCFPKLTYSLTLTDSSNIKKVSFGQNKDVITLDMFHYRKGTFFLHHDFSFDKRLVINLQDAKVWYKHYGLPFNFIGSAIKKDTLHIDGDDNLLTVFSIPFKVEVGDTLTLDFENFLQDDKGTTYRFDSIILIVRPYTKKR